MIASTLLQFSDFRLLSKCGEGDGGIVWKAQKKDDAAALYAVKLLKDPFVDLTSEDGFPREAAVMEALSVPGHPNIVKYYGWGKVSRQELAEFSPFSNNCDVAFIVMEWVEGATLEQTIGESSFGKNKRRYVFKQLLDAVHYMNAKNICHRNIFLNNIMISIPQESNSCLPRLVVCDFGAACYVPKGSTEATMEKDRRQCGGVLLALFSSVNITSQCVTNQLMQKDAFILARDLIDARNTLSLQAALRCPFLNATMSEDRFSQRNNCLWTDKIVEAIANYIMEAGSVQDFTNASLVCKQFFVIFQRRFLCAKKFPHPTSMPTVAVDAPVDECSMWIERVANVREKNVWKSNINNDEDRMFGIELIESCFEDHLKPLQDLVSNLSSTPRPWNSAMHHFHNLKGNSLYLGLQKLIQLAAYARDRANHLDTGTPKYNESEEKLLFLRIICTMRECLDEFKKQFMHQINFTPAM